MHYARLVCALVLLLSSTHSLAFRQDEYSITLSPASEGLSQSSVVGIFQDRNDFVWLLTQEGLNRFDGYEVLSFVTSRTDPTSISNQVTTDIAEDSNGVLWVATLGGGLNRFNESDFSFKSYESGPSVNDTQPASSQISRIIPSGNGGLWIGYADGTGFSHFDVDTERFTHYFLPNLPANAEIKGFAELGSKHLFIAVAGGGLFEMDLRSEAITPIGNTQAPTASANQAPMDPTDVLILRSGNLLITSLTRGAFIFNYADRTITRHPLHISTQADTANQIYSAMEDNEGNIWFGTSSGLAVYDQNQTVTWLTQVNTALPSDSVTSILQDRSGMVWIGTFSGLAQGTKSLFQKFTAEDGFSSSATFAIETDSNGDWWIGTSRGISHVSALKENGDWSIERSISELLQDHQIQTIEISEGAIWAGSYASGLFEIDTRAREITQYTADGNIGSISANPIPVIKLASNGMLLVGTFGGGLNLYDTQQRTFTTLRHNEKDSTTLSDDRVISLLEDSRKRIWVGTLNGLNLLDLESLSFHRFTYDPNDDSTLSNSSIFSLAEDNKGVLWVGTRSGGLNFSDNHKEELGSIRFQQLPTSVGLPSADTLGVLVDSDDNLWISHNAGITRINNDRTTALNFDETAGLQAREFNQGAAHVGETGSLFFGGQFGFNVIDPEKNYEDTYNPKIHVTGFMRLNENVFFDAPYTEVTEINLDYDYQFVSISFAALDYRRPNAIRYRYRISGIHDEWINLGRTHSVPVSGLGYGKYELQLGATNSSGVWSDNSRVITLNIAPPWWFTGYAYSVYAALLLSGILIIFQQQRAKAQQQLQRQLELEARVKERTHDLQLARNEAEAAARAKSDFLAAMSHEIRTPMHGVIGMTDLLLQSPLTSQQRNYALTAKESGTSLLTIINSILDYSKMEAGKLELSYSHFDVVTVVDNVAALLIQSAAAQDTELLVTWSGCEARQLIGDEGKIRQILINLIGNAIKFTKGGNVLVKCKVTQDESENAGDAAICEIQVEDTGIGISSEKLDSIFELFTQADASTTREYGGTGLGLAISRELTQLMSGDLAAESTPAAGSTFTLSIPLKVKMSTSPRPLAREGRVFCITKNNSLWDSVSSKLAIEGINVEHLTSLPPVATSSVSNTVFFVDGNESIAQAKRSFPENTITLASSTVTQLISDDDRTVYAPYTQAQLLSAIYAIQRNPTEVNSIASPEQEHERPFYRILLVEDVQVNQKIASEMLRSLGATVDIASNGSEALSKFYAKKFDLVFMDCQMPVLDGYQATKTIRAYEEENKLSRTPIVALTAGGSKDDEENTTISGMDGMVMKPFTTSDLKEAIYRFLAMPPLKGSSLEGSINTDNRISGNLHESDELVDSKVVDSLIKLDTSEEFILLKQLLENFSKQFSEQCTLLQEAQKNLNDEGARKAAHALKSMCANLGARSLKEKAAIIETASKDFVQMKCEVEVSDLLNDRSRFLDSFMLYAGINNFDC